MKLPTLPPRKAHLITVTLLLSLAPLRAGGDGGWPYYSPDAGRHWLQLTPQCDIDRQVPFAEFAVDGGSGPGERTHASHVIALAAAQSPDQPNSREASGCVLPPATCIQRPIAWTDDVGPEVAVAMHTATGFAGAMPNWQLLERAGGGGADLYADGPVEAWAAAPKWRYASVSHLPAPRGLDPTAPGGLCRVFEGDRPAMSSEYEASVPDGECRADNCTRCHGRRAETKMRTSADMTAVADRDAWCLDYAAPTCSCQTGASADCRYPTPAHLAIDPRNGWAYLTSDVGLLASPSGGRRWIRHGGAPASNPADVFKKMVGLDEFSDDPTVLGATLTTSGPAGQALDLNAEPARIQAMGRLSLAFTPCPTAVFYAGTQRRRGHLHASLRVSWLQDSGSAARLVESEFRATERADCDGGTEVTAPGALGFSRAAAGR